MCKEMTYWKNEGKVTCEVLDLEKSRTRLTTSKAELQETVGFIRK